MRLAGTRVVRSGSRLRTFAAGVVDHVRLPHLARVVQHGLVVQRQVGGPHHAAATGQPDALDGRVVEAEQRGRGDLAEVELADAERGLQLVGRRGLADHDQLGGGMRHVAEHPCETGGLR